MTPSLPHVLFGDRVLNPPPLKVSHIIWMAPYSLLRPLSSMTFKKCNIRKLWLKRNRNYSAAQATYFHFMSSFIRASMTCINDLLSLLLVRVCVSLSVPELDFKFQLFSISLSLTPLLLYQITLSLFTSDFFAHFK